MTNKSDKLIDVCRRHHLSPDTLAAGLVACGEVDLATLEKVAEWTFQQITSPDTRDLVYSQINL
jgi:hypothetical protein